MQLHNTITCVNIILEFHQCSFKCLLIRLIIIMIRWTLDLVYHMIYRTSIISETYCVWLLQLQLHLREIRFRTGSQNHSIVVRKYWRYRAQRDNTATMAINAARVVLKQGRTAFFVCDIQESFRKALFEFDKMVQNSSRLVNLSDRMKLNFAFH